MQRIGATLWPTLQTFQVYGANTNVGKTIVSTILCKAFRERQKAKVNYLKPVSTGAIEHADGRHISKFIDGVNTETIFQFSKPISPHLAARFEGHVPEDFEILEKTYDRLLQSAKRGDDVSIVETAGGVLSPAPSGNLQADLYRPLRLPVLFVGDFHLGGIGSTISGYESLKLRGYDVLLHLIFEEDEYQNVKYLESYFDERGVPTLALPKPPAPKKNPEEDMENMWNYYSEVTSLDMVYKVLDKLKSGHTNRITELDSMAERAHKQIWYPFTQHSNLKPKDILVIDSAYKNNFDTLVKNEKSKSESLLRAAVDGSASWWTQGLGHGNPELSLAAAYAAGRYGHVMFAGAIHEPALKITEALLEGHNNSRLDRVFFSDNGSTGMEVALKMALRASCDRYGWNHKTDDVKVLGLQGSYHGDTMGVMDSSEPSIYNDKVEWYRPKGFWFPTPQIHMTGPQKYTITFPSELKSYLTSETEAYATKGFARALPEIFQKERFSSTLYEQYTSYIRDTLKRLNAEGTKFGALLLEPILLGAGGMIFVDPVFHAALVNLVRNEPELVNSAAPRTTGSKEWSGVPVIHDEVFAGLHRLGPFNTNDLTHVMPDIVVNAKLLTGGLLPLCTTMAGQSIFKSFEGEDKTSALLHGHSYTAHAVGCQVAITSLETMQKKPWAQYAASENDQLWCVWEDDLVGKVAAHKRVEGVIALGTVLAVTLKAEAGKGGYNSTAAAGVQAQLAQVGEKGWMIHSRVLGNVMYFMSGLVVSKRTTDAVLNELLKALDG
ncbi:PLP-dependent transferase [Microthyrium microscopicum]|uniref:PLP-dependent transferase n=1 Tax=Microthyrium microscopicum TaxID=703497 RepID=A0A6A6UJI4_9PEZI|nr:PLP-dependent transferase [Microthyrium microscopicum]